MVGPDIIGVFIPIVAIVGGISAGVINKILKYKLRRLEIEAQIRQSGSDDLRSQIQALQAQVAQLRDTSASYDLTIDEQIQKLDRRVEYLETKQTRLAPSPPVKPEIVQQIGRSE